MSGNGNIVNKEVKKLISLIESEGFSIIESDIRNGKSNTSTCSYLIFENKSIKVHSSFKTLLYFTNLPDERRAFDIYPCLYFKEEVFLPLYIENYSFCITRFQVNEKDEKTNEPLAKGTILKYKDNLVRLSSSNNDLSKFSFSKFARIEVGKQILSARFKKRYLRADAPLEFYDLDGYDHRLLTSNWKKLERAANKDEFLGEINFLEAIKNSIENIFQLNDFKLTIKYKEGYKSAVASDWTTHKYVKEGKRFHGINNALRRMQIRKDLSEIFSMYVMTPEDITLEI
ncbi:MAG: hypothetical protein GY909_15575 [Oligoflexia bacterium]|nr:hypothetical protein [Oligoflexia bacterium]